MLLSYLLDTLIHLMTLISNAPAHPRAYMFSLRR